MLDISKRQKFFSLAIIVLILTASASFARAQYVQQTQQPLMKGMLFFPLFIGIIGFFLGIAMYAYSALAYMALAKKIGVDKPWLAWIPIANLYLMAKMAGMPTWPLWLLIGCLIPLLNSFFIIALAVFGFIWIWKIFEKVGRPGWWVLLCLIPFVGSIIFLVLLGVAAWGKGGSAQQSNTPPSNPTATPV